MGPRKVKFDIRTEDLKGYSFEISSGLQTYQFTNTFIEICEHVGSMHLYKYDTCRALKNLQTPTITIPSDP